MVLAQVRSFSTVATPQFLRRPRRPIFETLAPKVPPGLGGMVLDFFPPSGMYLKRFCRLRVPHIECVVVETPSTVLEVGELNIEEGAKGVAR